MSAERLLADLQRLLERLADSLPRRSVETRE